MLENDKNNYFKNNYFIDLDNKSSLEWLTLYSSQCGKYDLNNTLLVDEANFIIWFKYNGVDTLRQDEQSFLVNVKNYNIKLFDWFYIIDLYKKAHYIPLNIKVNFSYEWQKNFYLYCMEFINNPNVNILIDNIKKLW